MREGLAVPLFIRSDAANLVVAAHATRVVGWPFGCGGLDTRQPYLAGYSVSGGDVAVVLCGLCSPGGARRGT